MELILVENNEVYYDFIRKIRLDKDNISGFVNQSNIEVADHIEYMKKNKNCYYICLLNNEIPVGYVGVVDNDIRICTDPQYKNLGIGSFMLTNIVKIFPEATTKIFKNNTPSLNLFKKCKFNIIKSDETFFYLKNEL